MYTCIFSTLFVVAENMGGLTRNREISRNIVSVLHFISIYLWHIKSNWLISNIFYLISSLGGKFHPKKKNLSDDRRLYLHDKKRNLRSDVDGLTHTKQLILFCIVYILSLQCFLWNSDKRTHEHYSDNECTDQHVNDRVFWSYFGPHWSHLRDRYYNWFVAFPFTCSYAMWWHCV